MTFEQALSRFKNVKMTGNNSAMARCPAHEDKNPSLSICEKDGKILLKDFAGCRTEDILAKARLTFADLDLSLNGGSKPAKAGKPKVVATYDYQDDAGELLFQVVRFEPKGFKQRRPDGRGGWIWDTDGVGKVLFHLPQLRKSTADTIFICEGEKDTLTCERLGLTATCNPGGGAGKWAKEYSECLRGKHVVIIADNDETGRKHTQQVATALYLIADSVKVIQMPGNAKDLTEAVEKWRGTFDAKMLQLLASDAPIFSPDEATANDWQALFHSPEECLTAPDVSFDIHGFLQNGGMTFIGGLSGHAKTWLMLSIAKALLAGKGTKLWGIFPVEETAVRVLYLIPEAGLSSFMYRARRMGLPPAIRERRLLVRTLSKGPPPDLDGPLMLAAAKDSHVILDTAARFASGEENSASDNARGLAADIFALLAAGARTVICAHHSPKTFLKESVMSLEGLLRGTGDIGAMATTVWGVKQLDEPQNIVYLECVKARDFAHCEPFQLRGRPSIDETSDFELHRRPGESGNLEEEQPPRNQANNKKSGGKDDRIAYVAAWLSEDPNLPLQEIIEKFGCMRLKIDKSTASRYRALATKNLGADWRLQGVADGH